MGKEDDFAGFLHNLRKPGCRFLRCRLIVGGDCGHKPLVVASGIKSHDRDITFRRKIELYLACLGICYGYAKGNRISRQFLIQDIHLLIHIVCRCRAAVGHFHLVFALVSQIFIDIPRRLVYALFHFLPELSAVSLADHGNIGTWLQIQAVHVIIRPRLYDIQLPLIFLHFYFLLLCLYRLLYFIITVSRTCTCKHRCTQ